MADISCTTCDSVLGWKYVSYWWCSEASMSACACFAAAPCGYVGQVQLVQGCCKPYEALRSWSAHYEHTHTHTHTHTTAKLVYFLQEHAAEESQRYKVGKYIVEKARVLKEGHW